MIFKEIRRSETEGALEVVPEEELDLRLDMVVEVLRNNRFEAVLASDHVVTSRDDVTETTIYQDGRLLVMSLNPREVHRTAARVFEAATGNVETSPFEEYRTADRVKS